MTEVESMIKWFSCKSALPIIGMPVFAEMWDVCWEDYAVYSLSYTINEDWVDSNGNHYSTGMVTNWGIVVDDEE